MKQRVSERIAKEEGKKVSNTFLQQDSPHSYLASFQDLLLLHNQRHHHHDQSTVHNSAENRESTQSFCHHAFSLRLLHRHSSIFFYLFLLIYYAINIFVATCECLLVNFTIDVLTKPSGRFFSRATGSSDIRILAFYPTVLSV